MLIFTIKFTLNFPSLRFVLISCLPVIVLYLLCLVTVYFVPPFIVYPPPSAAKIIFIKFPILRMPVLCYT